MAPIPDEPGSVPTPDWAANGAELELDPTNFRNYGKNIAQVGKELSSDTMSAQSALQGPGGKDMLMSSMFEPGLDMQAFADRNAQEMGMFIPDLYKNVTAIASVALIMGEVFEKMDGNNASMVDAIEWAFQMDGAKKPGDVPSWLTDKHTIAKDLTPPPGTGVTRTGNDTMINQIVVGNMTITTYRTADGGTRTVQANGGVTTEYLDDKNGVRQYMITSTKGEDEDTTVTTLYSNGAPVGETRRTTKHDVDSNPNVVHQVTTSQTYDKDGKPVKSDTPAPSQHVVTYNFQDGSHARDYYSESVQKDVNDVDHDGNTEEKVPVKTDERSVSTQHDLPSGADYRQNYDELEQARRAAAGG
ncbi:hypothetical protein [Amycolatopsis methanolica]|uniref:Uncharacterized protein n=1 Tax=Amycolatopsis methanolica 239 TaxID=1068978 RepID=A0A076MTE3_AMYME|nr:hypothetical protein [Amycolatopsis methanolica]AIJ22176.1 hypothetical protein AMETH_2084 [Amycolatopsis methanolica 239]